MTERTFLQAQEVESGHKVVDHRFSGGAHVRSVLDTALVPNTRGSLKVHLRLAASNGAEVPEMFLTPKTAVEVV